MPFDITLKWGYTWACFYGWGCRDWPAAFAGVLTVKIEIGRRLKRLRTEKGLTQKGLAAAVSGGLDYTYIGKIERGEQLPSLKILIRISEALSVPVSSFFPDEPVPAVNDIASAGAGYQTVDEDWSGLFGELRLLHKDDIRLVTEIVKVLARHRKAMKGKAPDEQTG